MCKHFLRKTLNVIAVLISIGTIDSLILWFIDKTSFVQWLWKCFVNLAFISLADSGEQAFTIVLHLVLGLIAGMVILWVLLSAVPHMVMTVLGESNNRESK